MWTGSLPDTGDVWGTLIATDTYTQPCGVLKKEQDQIGRPLVAMFNLHPK